MRSLPISTARPRTWSARPRRRSRSDVAATSDLSYSRLMQNAGFDEALTARVDDMLDACTKCGACFKACPIAGPAGLGDADPEAVVSGVLDILRFGKGAAESEKWAKSCMASGECIKACDYGVNPRFLL